MSVSLREIFADQSVRGEFAGTLSWVRVVTVGFGVVLLGSFLSVFYRVLAITGDVRWLGLAVGGAVVLAVWAARFVPVRQGLTAGFVLLVGGVTGYLVLVPELHGFLFTVDFLVHWFAYFTGRSVLRFLAVDIWAITVAPAPTFLTVYLLLRRHYDYAAVAGGLMLGFFVLTGDADRATTLLGMISVLGVLGFGTIEEGEGSVEQIEQLAFVLAIAVIGNRVLRIVPDRHPGDSGGAGGGNGDSADIPITGALTDASGEADMFASISLSPAIQFSVVADSPQYWQISAYDRYTGRDWIRTGQSIPYTGPQSPPVGETSTLVQEVTVERRATAMPAAWKPVRVPGADDIGVEVTGMGGLQPSRSFGIGDTYTVISEIPRVSPDQLRNADEELPPEIRERYLQIPDGVPDEVARIASDVGSGADTQFDAVIAIQRWLERSKSYSLTVDRPEGDIVGGFLLSMESGYCVYFASAMVMLLRALGIPARFVLGYTPGEDRGGEWIVRGIHSHAWVEVYFSGIGWVPFDPTPREQRLAVEESRVGNTSEEWLDPLGRLENSQRTVANASEVTTTPTALTRPEQLGERVNGNRSRRALGVSPFKGVSGLGSDQDQVSILAVLVASVIGIHWAGVLDWTRETLRMRRQRPSLSRERDIQRAYHRLEQMLGRRFRARQTGETPRTYVAAIDVDDRRVTRVLELYEQARYAGDVSRADANEAIRLVDEVVAEYGVRAPLDRK